jgi:RHS repeat-associated protein
MDAKNALEVRYWHPDRLGTRLITNGSSSEVLEQATFPFGMELSSETSPRAKDIRRRFTSYDRDRNGSKLDYAVNRYYDFELGRFTQVDPLGMGAANLANPQSLNMYAYVRNDPVNMSDLTGLNGDQICYFEDEAGHRHPCGGGSGVPGEVIGDSPPVLIVDSEVVITGTGAAPAPLSLGAGGTLGGGVQRVAGESREPRTWTDKVTGQEYVNLWRQQEAFGMSAPTGWDMEHWWIETPSYEFGMGPLGSLWGTIVAPGGPTPYVGITDHKHWGREFNSGKPKPGYYVTRIYGPPGFTSRVNQQAELGKKLGVWGVPWQHGSCQSFCRQVLRNAGAKNIPDPLWSSHPLLEFFYIMLGGDLFTVYLPP